MHCHSLFKLSHETQYYGKTERHWNLYYLLAGTNAPFLSALSLKKDRRNSSTFNNITSMTVNSVQSKRSCVRVHFKRANENKKNNSNNNIREREKKTNETVSKFVR